MRRGTQPLIGALLLSAPGTALAQVAGVLASTTNLGASNEVREQLLCTGEFSEVEFIDLRTSAPSLSDLQQFHAVIVFSDAPPMDAVGLGDQLADYVDAGGGVVLATGSFTDGLGIEGRFRTDGLAPMGRGPVATPGGNLSIAARSGYEWLPGSRATRPPTGSTLLTAEAPATRSRPPPIPTPR